MDDQTEGSAAQAGPKTETQTDIDRDELTQLDPAYTTVLRIVAALTSLPFIIGALVLEIADLLPTGAIIAPVFLIALMLVLRLPMRRYQARGYRLDADRLRVVRGIWFNSDTVVPFARVQHIDVEQGPLERLFDLATLTVHTAGSHNASVHLPGLKHADATDMRETIRRAIGKEEF
ncbi:PH domain-containing protein [Paraurantiacibacter namhicola]|nr:PH domain-containing protein [Paraurantiacibacter namhicola]